MAITESKLNDNNIRRADLENYNLVNCNSYSNAGGVALYISKSLLYNKIDQFTRATTYLQSLFADIKLKDKDLVIGALYRHPNCTFTGFQNDFTQILNTLSHLKKEYIICGDINNQHRHPKKSEFPSHKSLYFV